MTIENGISTIEASALITLKAPQRVPRELLEAAAFHVEEVLGDHVADIAPGASACADFEHDTIEIDVTLVGGSPAELHQRLAIVIGALEQHSALVIGADGVDRLALMSSSTEMAAPVAA